MDTNTTQQKIREERKQRGLTQGQVANALGISRVSYLAIEQGKRELRLTEKQKLEELFGDSVQGSIDNQREYKQMILEFLSLPELKEVPKAKLAGLLYLADFGWYYESLESMSKLLYRKTILGPIPDYYFRAIDEMYEVGLIDIKAKETKDGHTALMISSTRAGELKDRELLNQSEKAFIKKVAQKWKDAPTREVAAFTRGQLPYQICRDDEIIPYSLITQEEPPRIV